MAAKQIGLYAPQTPHPLLTWAVGMSEQRKLSEPEPGCILGLRGCELTTIPTTLAHPPFYQFKAHCFSLSIAPQVVTRLFAFGV